MHGGSVDKKLPARPNLEHLRTQAKKLLRELKASEPASRLADAQLRVARQAGFASWPVLARHVEHLRALEGEWRIQQLEIEGSPMPKAMIAKSRILFDGDCFRTESPEATYEGVFTIDADTAPPRIDIEFVEGPEAGNWSYGVYQLEGDDLTLCLGLTGAPRPSAFATRAASGHALERLRRVSAARPANVTGGTPPQKKPVANDEPVDPAVFDVAMTPMLRRLEGEWVPIELTMDGKPMPVEWLAFGLRTMTNNEVKVVFGGQTMVHAKVRLDESTVPASVDYLNMKKGSPGVVSRGIVAWRGDEVIFATAAPGEPRPSDFTPPQRGTFSRWTRRQKM